MEKLEINDYLMSEALEKCLPSISQSTVVKPFGRILQAYRIRSTLKAKSLVTKACIVNHQLQQQPVNKPIFIIGLPRTGTTLLYNLLNLDERFKTPQTWELTFPGPSSSGNIIERQKDSRIKQTRDIYENLVTIYPNIKHTHDLIADAPEEDIWIFERCGIYSEFEYYYDNTQEYGSWYKNLCGPKMLKRYEYFKKELQCIGANQSMDKRQWLLKSRLHLFWIRSLLKVFPDAILIWTHRSLEKCIASYCSLEEIFGEVQQLRINDKAVYGRRLCKHLSDLAEKGTTARSEIEQSVEKSPFYDIDFKQLCKNPIEVLENFYNSLDLTIDWTLKEKFQKFLNENPKDKHGIHHYSLEKYGMNSDYLKKQFASYLSYHEKILK